jgi:hypothetical protein
VWDDLSPLYGGLGVGFTSEGSDADQIAGADVLTLTFPTPVILMGVGTLFDHNHTAFGTGFPDGAAVAAADLLSPLNVLVDRGWHSLLGQF